MTTTAPAGATAASQPPATGPGTPLHTPNLDRSALARLLERVRTVGDRPRQGSFAPFTGELVGEVPVCTEADVDAAARRARAAQRGWAATPAKERAAIFLRYHDLLLDRQAEILDLLQLETGKARKSAFEEVADVAMVARYYAHTAARHLAPSRRWGALPVLTAATEHHHPKGLVGVISPWNYPLTLAVTDAIAALLAGNAVLLKPDAQTPFTALWGVDLLVQAGLPADLVAVVTGKGSELGTPMIDRIDYLMFTGSTATGRLVAAQCGQRLIGCSAELGGKNAMIICNDADLPKTVEGALRGCYANSGQLCISVERMFVEDGIYDDFLPAFAERVRNLRIGPALDYTDEMGSLISEEQLAAVTAHVEDAVAHGATVLTGGRPRPDLGPLFYEPTVLSEVTPQMALAAEETFGPVVSAYRVADREEAVARANDTPYGLNSSVWTRDSAAGAALATRLQAGTANVNEAYAAAWASVDAPMGGMKDSGLGRRHGREGILKYTESQTVAVQRVLPMAAPRGMSEALYAKSLTTALRVLRRVPFVP